MPALSDAQRYAVSALDSAAGQPKSAYQLRVKLRTLESLVKMGMACDVTPPGPGAMFSPTTHYQFVWAQGRRDKPSEAPPPDAARQEGEVKQVGTIDLTPSWSALLPAYLAAVRDGSDIASDAAHSELARMARLADAYVALKKGS